MANLLVAVLIRQACVVNLAERVKDCGKDCVKGSNIREIH